MQKSIGIAELRRRFGAVLDEVVRGRVPYILERGDRPEAALIPYEDYARFQQFQEQDVLARFDRLLARMAEQNAGYGEDEVAADIAAARAEGTR